MKPLENRRVTGVASERYPINQICAHSECHETAVDPHHTFARSAIGNDSWFVGIEFDTSAEASSAFPQLGHRLDGHTVAMPHVTGLCRAHHEAVELHHAWIRLEDGVFNWYDRQAPSDPQDELPDEWRESPIPVRTNAVRPWVEWRLVGPLNPQPGSVEGKPKRKKREKREKQPARKKAVYSTRIPKDEAENGYEVLDSLIEANRERLAEDMGWSESVPDYFVLVAVLAEGLQ